MVKYEQLTTYEKGIYIILYVMMIEASIGIIGNTLAFIVFSRKRLNKYSFSFYNRARTFYDSFIMLHLFRHWSAFVLDANVNFTWFIICKFAEFSPWSAASVSVWLLAVNAFDRLITIVYPGKFEFIKTKTFQFSVVAFITIYSCAIHVPIFYYTELRQLNTTNGTQMVCDIPEQWQGKLAYWINMVDQMIVVFILNNVLSVIIIYNIYKSRAKFRKMKENKENKTAIRDRKFAINSTILNIKCFILKSPLLVISLLTNYLNLSPDLANMCFFIGVAWYTLDNSCAFFLNLAVNQMFYNEFKSIFKADKINPSEATGSMGNQSSNLIFLD